MSLAQTSLYAWHVAHQGRMVDFAGWLMPIQYKSIVPEHLATRTAAALFDVSHMGRLRFDGSDAAQFLNGLATRRVDNMQPGQVRYALLTNDQGGILDDILIYRLADSAGRDYYALVVNASNREKVIAWIQAGRLDGLDVQMTDTTLDTAMIAVQGPLALEIAQPLVDVDLSAMGYYTAQEALINEHAGIVSRTGYTGEDGIELTVPAEAAEVLWQALLDAGADRGVMAAGLGARDTLRLEAGMPLYGHELSETIDPYQAGLGFAVNLKDRQFPGRDALAALKAQSAPGKVRVGLQLEGKRVPREHYPVLAADTQAPIGEITSGTFSPTLQAPIAMAYVPSESSAVGTELLVDLRGTQVKATVVALPFYRRADK